MGTEEIHKSHHLRQLYDVQKFKNEAPMTENVEVF